MLRFVAMINQSHVVRASLSEAATPRREAPRPLTQLSERERGIVVDVAAGDALRRCMELGLVPGALVVVLATGDSMLLSVNGSRFGISREYLKGILVTPVSS